MKFFATSAAAQRDGFRACKRCRPDATPGSPAWNQRADVVGRAMRLIVDGVVDREGVQGLARTLGYSERHLHRQLVAEVGAGPLALAVAQRAQNARILIETTELSFSEIAFAAGFSSIRQFNDVVSRVFAMTPTSLRARLFPSRPLPSSAVPSSTSPIFTSAAVSEDRSYDSSGGAATTLTIQLPFRKPFAGEELLGFLSKRSVSAVEECVSVPNGMYKRSLRLAYGLATCSLAFGPDAVIGTFRLQDLRDMSSAVHRCRRLLDLDADPIAIADSLRFDDVLGDYVTKIPGLRVPGHVDGFEVVIRAIVGQQVSVAGARTTLAKLSARFGEPLPTELLDSCSSVTTVFPTPEALAQADPEQLGVPKSRGATLVRVAEAFASGAVHFDVGADVERLSNQLLALKGIGPWTTTYVRLRAFGDPDCFLPTDLGVKHAFANHGLKTDERSIERIAERWRPWRSYALMHLWQNL